MIQVDIFTGNFPYDLGATARKIRDLEFNTVQLDLHFSDIDISGGQITDAEAKRVRDTFRANELLAAGLGSLDYEYYVKRITEKSLNVPLIIEHFDESEVPRAKKFADDTLTKVGV